MSALDDTYVLELLIIIDKNSRLTEARLESDFQLLNFRSTGGVVIQKGPPLGNEKVSSLFCPQDEETLLELFRPLNELEDNDLVDPV